MTTLSYSNVGVLQYAAYRTSKLYVAALTLLHLMQAELFEGAGLRTLQGRHAALPPKQLEVACQKQLGRPETSLAYAFN